jgi:thiosulfate/3-mercaptopyruvate sulfurtransferase
VRGRDTYGVDKEFVDSDHGQIGCINCHKGQNVADKDKAHKEMVKDPSEEGGGGVCKECHDDITSTYKDAMHYKLTGILDIVGTITSPHKMEDTLLPAAWDLDCADCHASCGSCHVAWPAVAKGGLLNRHRFQKKPPMDKTCYACHGSRFAGEYMGKLTPVPDVHYAKLQMECVDCHTGEQLHHTKPDGVKRYYATETPRCEQCHPDAESGNSRVAMHNVHPKDTLACTVCHANEYFNCTNCHVSLDVKQPGQIKVIFPSAPLVTFKIGTNIDRSSGNPYKYNLVRHTPMKKDSLASLRYFQAVIKGAPGPEDLVANYDALPTWNSASVHNIQRQTKQNSSCNACHGHKELFLTKDDLEPDEPAANQKIIVDKIPAEIKK